MFLLSKRRYQLNHSRLYSWRNIAMCSKVRSANSYQLKINRYVACRKVCLKPGQLPRTPGILFFSLSLLPTFFLALRNFVLMLHSGRRLENLLANLPMVCATLMISTPYGDTWIIEKWIFLAICFILICNKLKAIFYCAKFWRRLD